VHPSSVPLLRVFYCKVFYSVDTIFPGAAKPADTSASHMRAHAGWASPLQQRNCAFTGRTLREKDVRSKAMNVESTMSSAHLWLAAHLGQRRAHRHDDRGAHSVPRPKHPSIQTGWRVCASLVVGLALMNPTLADVASAEDAAIRDAAKKAIAEAVSPELLRQLQALPGPTADEAAQFQRDVIRRQRRERTTAPSARDSVVATARCLEGEAIAGSSTSSAADVELTEEFVDCDSNFCRAFQVRAARESAEPFALDVFVSCST
jgi:hypothetical protein